MQANIQLIDKLNSILKSNNINLSITGIGVNGQTSETSCGYINNTTNTWKLINQIVVFKENVRFALKNDSKDASILQDATPSKLLSLCFSNIETGIKIINLNINLKQLLQIYDLISKLAKEIKTTNDVNNLESLPSYSTIINDCNHILNQVFNTEKETYRINNIFENGLNYDENVSTWKINLGFNFENSNGIFSNNLLPKYESPDQIPQNEIPNGITPQEAFNILENVDVKSTTLTFNNMETSILGTVIFDADTLNQLKSLEQEFTLSLKQGEITSSTQTMMDTNAWKIFVEKANKLLLSKQPGFDFTTGITINGLNIWKGLAYQQVDENGNYLLNLGLSLNIPSATRIDPIIANNAKDIAQFNADYDVILFSTLFKTNVKQDPTTYTEGNFVYTNSDQKVITKLRPGVTEKNIVIPNGVTTIASKAFSNTNIESITIPNSLETIDEYAFSKSSKLTDVIFEGTSNLKTIGSNAFEYTSVDNFVLPASVTSIGSFAFLWDSNLKSFSISHNSVLAKISYKAFCGTSITSFCVPASVTMIGDFAFSYDNNLKSFKFDSFSKLTSFGNFVFEANKNNLVVDFTPCSQLKNLSEVQEYNPEIKIVNNNKQNE